MPRRSPRRRPKRMTRIPIAFSPKARSVDITGDPRSAPDGRRTVPERFVHYGSPNEPSPEWKPEGREMLCGDDWPVDLKAATCSIGGGT